METDEAVSQPVAADEPVAENEPAGSPLEQWFLSFSSNPAEARQGIREVLFRDPVAFCGDVVPLLGDEHAGPAQDYLFNLLPDSDTILDLIATPGKLRGNIAVELVRHLLRKDLQFDFQFLRREMEIESSTHDVTRLEAALHVLDEVSDCIRLVPQLLRLLRHQDNRIRSKAAKLASRVHRNAEWFSTQLADEDPRICSNLIEGLLGVTPSEKEMQALRDITHARNHRVVTTALLVLHLKGDPDAASALEKLGGHRIEAFQVAAAWAMGQTGDLRFLETLQRMARETTGKPRRMALMSCVKLRKQNGPVLSPVENG